MAYAHWEDREFRDMRIRALRDAGFGATAISRMIGCHRTTVYEALDPAIKARGNAQRAARNTSPEGLQRQRDYRARKSA